MNGLAGLLVQLGVARPQAYGTAQDPDEIAQLRHVHCPRYELCLARATAAGWDGFHCLDCPGFDRLTPEEEERDRRALLRFWAQSPRSFEGYQENRRAAHESSEEH